jgi:hypothetical protein
MKNTFPGNEKFVTVHNKCSKILSSTAVHFATRVRRSRVVSVDGHVFFYAGSSIPNASEQSASRIHVSFVIFTLIQPHKPKSNGVRSADSNSSISYQFTVRHVFVSTSFLE